MFICWSAKGGSGTTVVASSLALVLSRAQPTVLVDLSGDVPAALGLSEPSSPGVHDWLASPTADAAALVRLAVPASDTMNVLPAGDRRPVESARWSDLAGALADLPSAVVDAGTGTPAAELLAAATHSLLVIRPCYLALRRAVAHDARTTGIVLVGEPGRALTARDVEHALGAPVVAELQYDPAVARAVDAGLLATRLPRTLVHQLRGAA